MMCQHPSMTITGGAQTVLGSSWGPKRTTRQRRKQATQRLDAYPKTTIQNAPGTEAQPYESTTHQPPRRTWLRMGRRKT